MKLQPATVIAAEIIEALYPHCVEIQVADSVRRHMPQVKDVEIVYISKTYSRQTDLFGTYHHNYFHTDNTITALIDDEILARDTVVKRWGSKYKRLVHCASGIVIEMFRAVPSNWGYILALRTGPADFNKMLVTPRAKGGALPPDIKLKDGFVWHIGRSRQPPKITVSTERGFFAAIDLPLIPPQERTAKYLKRLIQERQLKRHIQEKQSP